MALASLLAITGVAFAQGDQEQGRGAMLQPRMERGGGEQGGARPQQTIDMRVSQKEVQVSVAGNGNILMRGTVQTVASTSLTIKTWGGIWTITTDGSIDLSTITAGDLVGVMGAASQDAPTIAATVVRRWGRAPIPGVKPARRGDVRNGSGESVGRPMLGSTTPLRINGEHMGSSTEDRGGMPPPPGAPMMGGDR